jgi:hypothetical protein
MLPQRSPSLFYGQYKIIAVILLAAAIVSCNSSTPSPVGVPTSSSSAPAITGQPTTQGTEYGEAPAVLGFVLDPNGYPVAYASVANEFTDANGAVSGDLPGSPSGWLKITSLGYVDGYVKPGQLTKATSYFEARLTPFKAFLPLDPGGEVRLLLGDSAQPLAEFTINSETVSTLPAYIEATVYNLADVDPAQAPLSNNELMDLALAVAVQASSGSGDPINLASGKSIELKIFPDPTLPVSPTLAIFDPQAGVWQVEDGACTPDAEGGLSCTIASFSPLIGLFGPHVYTTSALPTPQFRAISKPFFLQAPTDDDQAYREALNAVEEWARFMEWELRQTGTNSPESQQEMSNRLGDLGDAAEAYAADHPDASGVSHLLKAAELAYSFGELELSAKLIEQAKAVVEKMADDLLKESDCGRIREMYHVLDMLISLGASPQKEQALRDKIDKLGECDMWLGRITIEMPLSSTNPGLDRYSMESGGQSWIEEHSVMMATNISTYILKGEDKVNLDFGEVMYGKKDEHDCHDYLTHSVDSGGSIVMKFDGRYDGYTFTIGDLQPEGGSATIMYGAHAERWDDEKDECEEIADQMVPAPNYTTLLRHGFSGSPPITIQEMLLQGDNDVIKGSEQISNDAYDLGIYPVQSGTIRWYFFHTQKYLPLKE